MTMLQKKETVLFYFTKEVFVPISIYLRFSKIALDFDEIFNFNSNFYDKLFNPPNIVLNFAASIIFDTHIRAHSFSL